MQLIKNDEAAAQMAELAIETYKSFNQTLINIEGLCDKQEYEWYKEATSKVLFEMLMELANPIFAEKPQYKPDGFD